MGPEPEVNLGSQYYEEGRYQEAADYYQEKVDEVFQTASGMNRPTVRSILTCMAYYKLENYDQALLYLEGVRGCGQEDFQYRRTGMGL